MSEMIRAMPDEYRTDPWTQTVFDACQNALHGMVLDPAAVLGGELLLGSMSEAQLVIEERLCGITPAPGQTVQDRKSAVAARWRSGGPVTLRQIQAVADAWRGGEVNVSFTDGVIHLQFVGEYGVPDDMDGLMDAIERMKPAHLPVRYALRYLLVRDAMAMTVADMAAQPLNKFAGGR